MCNIYPLWRSSSAVGARERRRHEPRPAPACRPPTVCLPPTPVHHTTDHVVPNSPITFLIYVSENFWTHQLSA